MTIVSAVVRLLAPVGALAALAALSSCSPVLPACDGEQTQTLLRQALATRNATVSSITNIATSSRAGNNATCTAHVSTNIGDADLTYTLTLEGSRVNLLITQSVATPAAGAAGAPAAGGSDAAAGGAGAAGQPAGNEAPAAQGSGEASPAEGAPEGAPPAEGGQEPEGGGPQ
jgi:hypothetical protein